jgi:DNA (cytosine-5)-methyltransferase 1
MDAAYLPLTPTFKADGVLPLRSFWQTAATTTTGDDSTVHVNLVGNGNHFVNASIVGINGRFDAQLELPVAAAKNFVRQHRLKRTDGLRIVRLDDSRFRLCPAFESIRFIDLFAGIGGMRMALEAAGGECVFSCEWNRFAQKTYAANFNDWPAGDLRDVEADDVPDHEILVGGFPCQPFSIAGVSKKNSLGREHGFRDKAQGTLFFDVARIIDEKRPTAFILENVKNLRSHDKGRTFEVILRTLQDELGYKVHCKIIDGGAVVPQHRERIYLVGLRDGGDFQFPDVESLQDYRLFSRLGELLQPRPAAKYRLSDKLWRYLQDYAEKHRKAGNGFGFSLVGPNDTTRTLSARYHKDGSEILVRFGQGNPRRLTPRECARLMGFPESFQIPVSDTQAYQQFGNSVVVPVVQAIAERLVATLRTNLRLTRQPASRRKQSTRG